VSSAYIFNEDDATMVALPQIECTELSGTAYESKIENNSITPSYIYAKRCDRITVTNLDNEVRRIAFGKHEQHVTYDGITETILPKDKSFTFVLRQTGKYVYHDHNNDEVKADFIVSSN